MEPLAEPPRTFRECVEADLRRGARLIIKVQDELDPQFRMATPEGDYHIAVTLPPDDYERRRVHRVLATFMAWRQVTAFTMCAELVQPDCVFCIGVSKSERHACLSVIKREARPWTAGNFGAVQWLPHSKAQHPFADGLLANGPRALTPKDVAACNSWFGKDGRFPAVHVPTGEVRGV